MVKQAYGKYKQLNQDERLRSIDEAHQRFLTDIASDRAEARQEGREEGIVVGIDKGIVIGVDKGIVIGVDKRNIEIASNMKRAGSDFNFIAQITGLSLTEIERLN